MERRASSPVGIYSGRSSAGILPAVETPAGQSPGRRCYNLCGYPDIPREATTRGTSSAFPLCKLRNAASRIS